MRKHSLVLLASLFAIPPTAGAQTGIELTLATGIRSGDASFPIEARGPLILCVTTPCVLAEARTEEGSFHPTLIVDVPIAQRWMVEGLVTRMDGQLRLGTGFPLFELPSELLELDTYLLPETFELDTLQVGLLRHWGDRRFRPFAAAGLGVTAFESTALAYDRPLFPGIVARPVDEEVLSASLAGGLKIDLGKRFALRLEARVFWHDLSDRLGGTLEQGAGSLGLTYRF